MTSATVTIDVDVDLYQFDKDDLVEELERRGVAIDGRGVQDYMDAIYLALKFGRDAQALALMRAMIEEWKGCILL